MSCSNFLPTWNEHFIRFLTVQSASPEMGGRAFSSPWSDGVMSWISSSMEMCACVLHLSSLSLCLYLLQVYVNRKRETKQLFPTTAKRPVSHKHPAALPPLCHFGPLNMLFTGVLPRRAHVFFSKNQDFQTGTYWGKESSIEGFYVVVFFTALSGD